MRLLNCILVLRRSARSAASSLSCPDVVRALSYRRKGKPPVCILPALRPYLPDELLDPTSALKTCCMRRTSTASKIKCKVDTRKTIVDIPAPPMNAQDLTRLLAPVIRIVHIAGCMRSSIIMLYTKPPEAVFPIRLHSKMEPDSEIEDYLHPLVRLLS